jgi:hypothetical protein
MDWFQYSCCAHTFSRVVIIEGTPVRCPRCYNPVAPFVRLQVKQSKPDPQPNPVDRHRVLSGSRECE